MRRMYVESSVISRLTARLSHNIMMLAKQITTRDWWDRRSRYNLYISELVLDEIRRGDRTAAARRFAAVDGLPLLPDGKDVDSVADHLVTRRNIPANQRDNARHIAIAATRGMDCLVTWNQAHIVNPITLRAVQDTLIEAGVSPPLILTPDYFWENLDE